MAVGQYVALSHTSSFQPPVAFLKRLFCCLNKKDVVMEKKINICMITDDNYIVPTAVAITSLIKSKKADSCYNIYIVTAELSDENVEAFNKFNQKGIKVQVIKASLDKFKGMHKQQKGSICVASEAALLKFELPNLLKRHQKILYLDGDILVKGDLSELFEIDIKDNLCAAAYDTGRLYSKYPKLLKYPQYFNSGVMLLNLALMRKEKTSEKLCEAKKKSTDFNLMDQDIFNEVFNNRVKIIDIKYNLLILNLKRAQGKYKFDDLNKLYNNKYTSLKDIEDKAVILHFSSKDKPWKYTDAEYSTMWAQYFKESPYAEMKLRKTSLKEEMGIKFPVVISLTSYPARIRTVHQTIETLLNQSIKADKVVLWLAKEQFLNKEKDLPPQLLELTKRGLEIEWCHDIKSFKKLVPALKKYSESIIVTADDDVLYSADWLKRLLVSYVKDPQYIHCHRAHYMSFEKRQLKPYNKWYQSLTSSCISYNNFLTGGGGALFPPHCLAGDVVDEETFMRLCPQADDIWFWAMAVKNNMPIKVVENNIAELTFVDDTQEQALWHSNVTQGGNDVQLKNVLEAYPEILEKLVKNEVWEGCKIISKYKLFGFIPLFKVKKRGGVVKYYLFGLPLVKIKDK